jgi:lysozyme family protein
MYGVTEAVARANGFTGDMHDLKLDQAQAIAKAKYWDVYQCDQFDSRVAFQVFDAAYNGGHPAQWLQQAVGVTADGVIGTQTIAAVRSSDPLKIILKFDAYRLQYMAGLGVWNDYSKGWVRRIANNMIVAAS